MDDTVAIGAMQYLINEKKISIPDEIAISGFDNISLSRLTFPPLTTVGQPIEKIAKEATSSRTAMLTLLILPYSGPSGSSAIYPVEPAVQKTGKEK